jgi:cytochrome c5
MAGTLRERSGLFPDEPDHSKAPPPVSRRSLAETTRPCFALVMHALAVQTIAANRRASERRAMKRFCLAVLMICAWGQASYALDREQQRGKALLQTLCGRCHAVSQTGQSPHIDAPAFRTFGDDKLYDNDFAKRLQDGLETIHPDMPTFQFSRPDAEAAVNYLKFIQGHKKSK